MKRSEMICKNCDYSAPSVFKDEKECRRHAPNGNGWDCVKDEEWCGDGLWREKAIGFDEDVKDCEYERGIIWQVWEDQE